MLWIKDPIGDFVSEQLTAGAQVAADVPPRTLKTLKHPDGARRPQLTWSDHDLVLLGADPQEGEVVLRVDVSYGATGLHHQLVDQSGVLHRAWVVQGRLDGDS